MSTITSAPATNLALEPRGPSPEEVDGQFREALDFFVAHGYKPNLSERQLIMLLSAPTKVTPDPNVPRSQALALITLKVPAPVHAVWGQLVDHLHPSAVSH